MMRGTAMPTVMRSGPLRFFFYSNESNEPAHIHVQRDKAIAKFWLSPIALARAKNFSAHELNDIRRQIEDNATELQEAWNEHFDR